MVEVRGQGLKKGRIARPRIQVLVRNDSLFETSETVIGLVLNTWSNHIIIHLPSHEFTTQHRDNEPRRQSKQRGHFMLKLCGTHLSSLDPSAGPP